MVQTQEDPIALLEQKAVKYAIAVEAREAVHTYLKLWGTVFAAITAAATFFGISLSKSVTSLDKTVSVESERLTDLQTRTNKLGQSLIVKEAALEEKAKSITTNTEHIQQNADKMAQQSERFTSNAIAFNDRSFNAMKTLRDSETSSSKSAALAAEHLSETTKSKVLAADAATRADNNAERLKDTMLQASTFATALDTQRRVFRDALLDYVTLTSNATSPELVLVTPNDDSYYVLQFTTPHHVTSAFTLSYDVTDCHGSPESKPQCKDGQKSHHTAEIESERNRRNWHTIEGTEGRYRFAIDYIFISGFARNFVTIRIAGTEKLLAQPPITPTITTKR